jgi:hypothetical protein
VAGATFVSILAGLVFIGQLIGKWQEGGWIALLGFSILTVVAHVALLSPLGYREAGQVHRIVHEKARVQGAMASIVKFQAFKMQEYRYRLMIAIAGFAELFGIGQRRRAWAAVGVGAAREPGAQAISPIASQTARASRQRRNGRGVATKKTEPGPTNPNKLRLPPHIIRHRIIVPVNGVDQGTLTALRYAESLSSDVTAVHVSLDSSAAESLQQLWKTWGDGVRLVILPSPHNMVLEPLLEYIQGVMALRQSNEIVSVVVPQSTRPQWWSNLLRTQMAVLLRLSLPFETGIVITDVPYELDGYGK